MDVLDEIARGLSNKEAGRILGISPRTVEGTARVMEKLGARNTADLMRIVLPIRTSVVPVIPVSPPGMTREALAPAGDDTGATALRRG